MVMGTVQTDQETLAELVLLHNKACIERDEYKALAERFRTALSGVYTLAKQAAQGGPREITEEDIPRCFRGDYGPVEDAEGGCEG